jgi:hypothetical protein
MFKKKIFTLLSAGMMAVMVGASMLPVLTAWAVTSTRSEDLIFQKDSTGNVVAILSKNGLITPIGDVLVIYNASGVATGIKTIYGEVIAISGTGTTYTLPVATSSVLGGVKPDGTTAFVNASGVLSVSTISGAAAAGTLTGTTLASNVVNSSLTSAASGVLGTGAYTASYSLPTASSSVSGGVKVDGTTIVISSGVISTCTGTARTLTASASAVLADVCSITTINSASEVVMTIDTDANIGWGTNAALMTWQQAGGAASFVAASGVTVDVGVGIPSSAIGRFLGALRVAANHWVTF